MAPTVPIDFTGQKESRKCSLLGMMGKSRKFSKGHSSSGFVPDYRHAVETIGESEGFGSSGRVETEMTASEGSCAPKRKCISLNVDGYDSFGVPVQVLSVSTMSRSERKDLELRLRLELEQVRVVQNKFACMNSNVTVLSTSSDIRSCIDGQKRRPLEGFNRSAEVLAPVGKKRAPAGRNGSRTKKGTGRVESIKYAAPTYSSNATSMKHCEILLNSLMSHQFGWVFNTPVDVVKLNIPDYFTVIKHPMDFGTVKSKMASGQYSSPLDFSSDVRLTFSNAMTYNPTGNDVHFMAGTLSKYFEKRWKAIEKKLPVTANSQLEAPRSIVNLEVETGTQMPPSKKKKITPNDNKVKQGPARRIMTNEEKCNLGTELENLLGELPESIVDFLKENSFNGGQTSEDEIEIDINALSDDTLFTLQKLLDNYLLEKRRNQAKKAEPCEMELLNESGFSNSSMQPCKGNDTVDEDVDIVGGNDPPMSTLPLVGIETDATHRNCKASSSSSSGSESGSSSSDSDSGSSSGSESDVAKASLPVSGTKENMSGANLDQKRGDLGDPEIGNESVNGIDQVENNSASQPSTAEADGRQEGESAPSERQVSPEKLYRAALLRNRFADTILKAQEKTLEKGEKRDPEKLRIEKEELERRQREEKARLQAEAKAAEEARRKAEAEVAAEAKRKRELEREAARQKLLEMEKTVDIDENSQFMEDLEMLRATQDDQLPSFIEETSPDHSQNGLGSFKLQGSNPLEQLGLYMKMDDDDEDDEEEEQGEPPQNASQSANDVEEGEID